MIEWKVEEIESINFDENGKEKGTWNGYGVTKISDPANYCFCCRNKTEAERLCEFLNDNLPNDELQKWKKLLDQLKADEKTVMELKETYKEKEMDIIQNTDFEKLYNGRNNKDIRKAHVTKKLKPLVDKKKNLELKIEHTKKEISYLKAATYRKTELMRLR